MSYQINSFDIPLIMCFSKIITDDDMSDKIRELKFEALRSIRGELNFFKEAGYSSNLLYSIAEKKSEMINGITTKEELNKIQTLHSPHYDGNKFTRDKFMTAEEELIGWSMASLRAPLNSAATKRYLELFRELYPKEAVQLNLDF